MPSNNQRYKPQLSNFNVPLSDESLDFESYLEPDLIRKLSRQRQANVHELKKIKDTDTNTTNDQLISTI